MPTPLSGSGPPPPSAHGMAHWAWLLGREGAAQCQSQALLRVWACFFFFAYVSYVLKLEVASYADVLRTLRAVAPPLPEPGVPLCSLHAPAQSSAPDMWGCGQTSVHFLSADIRWKERNAGRKRLFVSISTGFFSLSLGWNVGTHG